MNDRSRTSNMTNDSRAERHHDTELAIGCFASICRNRLADRLLSFARDHPDIELGVHEMMRASLLPALEKGELALAIIPEASCSTLNSAILWQDRVMIALHRAHPLAVAETILPQDLTGELFLVSRQQHGGDMHRFLLQRSLPGEVTPNSMLLDLSPALLMEEVAAGRGVFLLCGSHDDLSHPAVTIRPVDSSTASFQVCAYWQGARPQNGLAALIATLTETGKA